MYGLLGSFLLVLTTSKPRYFSAHMCLFMLGVCMHVYFLGFRVSISSSFKKPSQFSIVVLLMYTPPQPMLESSSCSIDTPNLGISNLLF